MITIDGAFGYGQVLRTAIALSALTLKPVKIINIRKNRPKPGLMPQHLAGLKVAAEFCNAELAGAFPGSMEVSFVPKNPNFLDKRIDIGTAGSVSLLLQTLTPLLIFAESPVSLEIIGGTAGLGSPTIEYTKYVTFPILQKLGVKQPEIEILRQGFYPKGQGFVRVKFSPTKKLEAIELVERGKVKSVRGISIAGSLPKHVAHRQAYAAKAVMLSSGYVDCDLAIQNNLYTASSGTSITLWAECEKTILGSDKIGEMGKPAENVGREAAMDLLETINSQAALDKFMADQIIPFLALAHGRSTVTIEKFTDHVETNLRVTEQILGVKFEVNKYEKKISVEGIGYQK
jgi:RNA 3'-terminal phosphate cyclase (ATP)